MAAKPTISVDELAKHSKEDDLWIAIDDKVYDVTKFAAMHPGGTAVLMTVAGKPATEEFWGLHKGEVLEKYKRLHVAMLGGAEPAEEIPLIEEVPFGEPVYLREGWFSPYQDESHVEFRKAVRTFNNEYIVPPAEEHEDNHEPPSLEVYQKMGDFGLLAARIGPPAMPFVKQWNLNLPAKQNPDTFNYFHQMIGHQEMGRVLVPGWVDGCGAGFCIGCPPVIHFCKPEVRDSVLKDILLGNKRISLAISEPQAGSDVAAMVTAYKKQKDGSYLLTGAKKWITNGFFSDYWVTAARDLDGKKGHGGISLFLVPKQDNVSVKAIKTSYSSAAGTAYVMYDDAVVPPENLMGKEHKGFIHVMANFNPERWYIVAQQLGSFRRIICDCMKWVRVRKVFGKPLITQPVIRQHLGQLICLTEANEAWLEQITDQMCNMDYQTMSTVLAGPIALLKYHTTRTGTRVSDLACQIFGGRALTKTGMGRGIEHFQKTFKFASILGGSEEVMADLGVRQSLRDMKGFSRL